MIERLRSDGTLRALVQVAANDGVSVNEVIDRGRNDIILRAALCEVIKSEKPT